MLYSHWPSSDRYCKTLESSKWSVDMLTWRRTTWLNTHGKLTRFLQKMSHICPTRKNQRLEEVIKWLIINGTPYRIRTCDLRLRRPLLYPAELRAPWEASASRSETPGIIRSTSVESIHFARKLRGLYDAGEISSTNCTRSIPPGLMRA